MLLSEEELINRSRGGDVAAFELLISRYEKKLYTIAFRFMGNHDDASDLAQEALIRTFSAIRSFRGDSSFTTWLYHIAANVCRDELRRRRRYVVSSLDEPMDTEDGTVVRQAVDSSPLPEKIYEQKETIEYIQSLINDLLPDYRLVLVMREFEGFSYEEIAGKLDCSLGTVKSRLSRARKILRDRIVADREHFDDYSRLLTEGRESR